MVKVLCDAFDSLITDWEIKMAKAFQIQSGTYRPRVFARERKQFRAEVDSHRLVGPGEKVLRKSRLERCIT